ncbi:hypothetical protein PCANC_20425 [Puccinia coronata f. sp. avenae]|uniref:Uncharacterized protein n=1 Tax=Puccinia coronata f. sp. avenae TaxID=200324 RepID=A0A2N5SEE2_9BASI|nr:hypothetical protein PCANC_20425 [Puccinia coronata f. sp. avenae]
MKLQKVLHKFRQTTSFDYPFCLIVYSFPVLSLNWLALLRWHRGVIDDVTDQAAMRLDITLILPGSILRNPGVHSGYNHLQKMSETGSELENQSVAGDDSIDFLRGIEASKLDDHLLRKGQHRPLSSGADMTVESAVELLSREIPERDLEDDESLNLRLARAAETISNFLKLANLSISSEEEYDMLPGWMRRELVKGLDRILSERFLNALFFLRQQIRHLAIKRELVVSYQMVTLSDVVIAAIIDHVSCHGSSGESKRTLEDGTKYSTIELVVRLPQRMDSLANFLATPILSVKPDLNLKIKLGALAILYCSRCLSPSSGVNFRDEIHPFRPATNSALWKLLIQLFPDTALISRKPLIKTGHKIFFYHGFLIMPWIWWNRCLCPAQDSNWVGVITLLWIRQEYSWLNSNSNNMRHLLSKTTCYGLLQGWEETSNFSRLVDSLLANHAIGFKILLMEEDQNFWRDSGIGDSSLDHITLVMLQIYSTICDSRRVILSTKEKEEICAQIEKILRIEINRSFESSAGLGLIEMTLSLPQKAFDRLIQGLDIILFRLLESLLLEIEISADPTYSEEETLSHQRRALSKSMFLTRCVDNRTLDEHSAKSSVINLVNILLTPLRCDHTIALAVTKLILCICKSAKEGKTLSGQKLRTISEALIEVMTRGHESTLKPWQGGTGVEAGPLTADFVKRYCSQFDYQTKYPLAIYSALREELANELWSQLTTLPQTELPSSNIDNPHQYSDACSSGAGNVPCLLIAEGMHALFTRFSELERKFVKASPLRRELLAHLESSHDKISQKLIDML